MEKEQGRISFVNIMESIGNIILVLLVNTPPMMMIMSKDKLTPQMMWIGCGVWLVLVFGIIAYLWKSYHRRFDVTSPRLSGRDILIDIAYAVGALFIAIAGMYLLQVLTGKTVTANDKAIQDLMGNMKDIPVILFIAFQLAIGLFAPIVEELVFRGIMNNSLFKKGQWMMSALVTSSIFALLHISTLAEFFVYFGLGLILFMGYQRNRNIKDSILIHMLNNGRAVLFFVYQYMMMAK